MSLIIPPVYPAFLSSKDLNRIKKPRPLKTTAMIYKKKVRVLASDTNSTDFVFSISKSTPLSKVEKSVENIFSRSSLPPTLIKISLSQQNEKTSLNCRKIAIRIKHAPLQSSRYFNTWQGICKCYFTHLNSLHLARALHEFVCKWMNYPKGLANRILKDNQEMLERIKAAIMEKKEDLNPKQIALAAWSYARLGLYDEAFFQVLKNETCKKIEHFNALDLSMVVLAFADLGIDDSVLFAAISKAARCYKDTIPGYNLATIALSFANANIKDEALFKFIDSQIRSKVDQLNVCDLSQLIWSFAILFPDSSVFEILFEQLDKFASFLTYKDLMQIYHADLGLGEKYLQRHPKLSSRVKLEICSEIRRPPRSSDTHVDVMKTLDRMGSAYDYEVREYEYYLDIVLKLEKAQCENTQTSLEVNGPHHYLRSGRLRGRYVLKEHIFEMRKNKIIQINYKDWDNLRTKESKEAFLRDKINRNEYVL